MAHAIRFVLLVVISLMWCAPVPAVAQVTVIGTGNAAADVAAVQAAVDTGGLVWLQAPSPSTCRPSTTAPCS